MTIAPDDVDPTTCAIAGTYSITTPIILIFVLPKQVTNIVHFIRTNTIDIRNVGNICKFAEFNFNSKNEKMERSITTFKDNHE